MQKNSLSSRFYTETQTVFMRSVLGRLLPAPLGRAGADGAAAPFHLPSARVAGAALAGGVSAASAGAVWSAQFCVLFAAVS